MNPHSAVLAFPPPPAADSVTWLEQKLRYYTDAWDLAKDLSRNSSDILVIDSRSPQAYAAGHIACAINFPHRTMSAETTAMLDRTKVYVTYCDGIGCNGSTKAAWKLAALGFQVKELIGGLDFWQRDRHPLISGNAPGSWPEQASHPECGC